MLFRGRQDAFVHQRLPYDNMSLMESSPSVLHRAASTPGRICTDCADAALTLCAASHGPLSLQMGPGVHLGRFEQVQGSRRQGGREHSGACHSSPATCKLSRGPFSCQGKDCLISDGTLLSRLKTSINFRTLLDEGKKLYEAACILCCCLRRFLRNHYVPRPKHSTSSLGAFLSRQQGQKGILPHFQQPRHSEHIESIQKSLEELQVQCTRGPLVLFC